MSSILSIHIIPFQSNLTRVPEELLWSMTAIFLTLTLAYLSSVFYFRTRIKNRSSREAELKKELAPMISKFLFYTEEDPLEARREYVQLKIQIRQLLKDGLTRTVLSEVLQDLKKDVSGSARKELLNLYSDLGLQEDAIQRLKSRRWEVLSRAILELTEMEVRGAYGLIKRHVNHRSSIVRKQAQIATVSLKTEGITYFLDTNRYPISEWQQLKLLDVIRHLDGFTAPNFKNWLTSRNADVVLFALRLIKYYKQNDATSAIIQLVNHRNQQIKIEAIQCIREFYLQEAKEPLKKAFPRGNEEVKLLTLDTLGLIGDTTDIEFLQHIVNKGATHIISSKASGIINILKPETILPEEGIESPEEIISTPTDIKAKDMEKEVKKDLSIHLPKPDFKEYLMAWEDLLDPDFEDEVIFSHCCLEEFRELVQEIGEPLIKAGDPGTLPLDFLPLVITENTEEKLKETTDIMEQPAETPPISNSDLDYPVHAEERIIREIEALLAAESEENPDIQEEKDVFDLNFLPILVDNDPQEDAVENESDRLDFHSIEVIAETLKHRVPEAFSKVEKPTENYSVHVPPEQSFEAIKAINWSAIANNNLQVAIPQEPETFTTEIPENEETHYGFSIFQELFRTADTESKLILLDEVLAIGDEKELFFLNTLAEDPSNLVRNKAAQIHSKLASRLMQEHEPEQQETGRQSSFTNDPVSDVLFDLSFEPQEDCFLDAEPLEESASDAPDSLGSQGQHHPGNLMSRFLMLTHKILEKIYG